MSGKEYGVLFGNGEPNVAREEMDDDWIVWYPGTLAAVRAIVDAMPDTRSLVVRDTTWKVIEPLPTARGSIISAAGKVLVLQEDSWADNMWTDVNDEGYTFTSHEIEREFPDWKLHFNAKGLTL